MSENTGHDKVAASNRDVLERHGDDYDAWCATQGVETDRARFKRERDEARAELAAYIHREDHKRFVDLMTGPNPAEVWRSEAVRMAHELDEAWAVADGIRGWMMPSGIDPEIDTAMSAYDKARSKAKASA